jgi:hypothetical protein
LRCLLTADTLGGGMRVGPITQEQAEQRLEKEMAQVDLDLARRAHRRPTFAECAQRYLAQSQDMRSLEAVRVHAQLLVEHIGHLEPHRVHDATLALSSRRASPMASPRPRLIARWGSHARSSIARRARTATKTVDPGWRPCRR